jgi:predicted molibdopterin-dependent oxidoreductase YjgC
LVSGKYHREAKMDLRVNHHVVLGDSPPVKMVEITVDGKKIVAREGEKVLAALIAQGIIINRYTVKKKEPRGLFCGIGQCTDCAMIVDGRPNVRTCMTPVKEGMIIETQHGLGDVKR